MRRGEYCKTMKINMGSLEFRCGRSKGAINDNLVRDKTRITRKRMDQGDERVERLKRVGRERETDKRQGKEKRVRIVFTVTSNDENDGDQ